MNLTYQPLNKINIKEKFIPAIISFTRLMILASVTSFFLSMAWNRYFIWYTPVDCDILSSSRSNSGEYPLKNISIIKKNLEIKF